MQQPCFEIRMLRITPYIFNSRTLLYRRHLYESQLASLSRFPTQYKYKNVKERETCPQPLPPPPPPPKDDRLFWGAMTIVVLAGGFAVYAKTQPEIRDWLTIRAPWFDDLIAIAYQENMTYSELATECFRGLKKYIGSYFEDGNKPRPCSLEGKPVPIIADVPDYPAKEEKKKDDKEPCEKLPSPFETKDVCEIETCIKDLGDAAVNNYYTAKEACVYYNKLVEETMTDFTMPKMKKLHHAMTERLDLVNQSLKNAKEATTQMNELMRYLECGRDVPSDVLEKSKALIMEYQEKIKAEHVLYQWQNDIAVVMDARWLKVETVLDKYADENQTMFPGLKYENEKPKLKGDGDLLLYHTLRYAQLLKEELADAVAGMTERVNRGLETLPQGEKEVKARDGQIQAGVKKARAELDKDYKRRYDEQKSRNDKTLKDSLKKQSDKHQETIKIRLAEKEREATVKLNKLVAEKVECEKKQLALQLAEMAKKLKLVEDKLNARLKAERETRRSQELWTAGASLLAATKKGKHHVKVDKELKAIEKASGNDDKLVLTVLKAIPQNVREKGVVPESVLREKYHVMEKVALKVALVEQDGAPLPVYMLSWLQYALLFMKISGIPRAEYDNIPEVPSKDLDTFDLLQRARFWVERGNLAAAVRYVNALEGASRGAASSWYEAARSHLETRQAAEAVIAHAAALGLQYI